MPGHTALAQIADPRRWTFSTSSKSVELHFGEGLVAQDAGVVDENVDPAPARLRRRDHRGDLRGVGDVGAVGHGDAARRSRFRAPL